MELADDADGPVASCKLQVAGERERPTSNFQPATYVPHTLKHDLYRRTRLPVDECIQIGLALTTALEHLHAHGLVHRDIKPSNIIFVNGVPKLADIGLVATMDKTMSFVGTSGFLPPEGPGTPQADIYSLGKVLYEISMGRDRQEFPKLSADLAESAEFPRLVELNAIILKACHHDPRQRYQSGREMAAELALLQNRGSVRRKRALERRWAMLKKLAPVPAVLGLLVASPSLIKVFKPSKAPNTEAVRLYNLGRDYAKQLTDEDLKKSVQYLDRAIQADPEFVPAYVTLFEVSASVLVDGSWDKRFELQKQCAGKLMALAPQLGESHAALSWVRNSEQNWAGAEAEIKQAIKLSPNYAPAYGMYGCYMTWWLNRVDEAGDMFKRAQELDPESPMIATCAGFPLYARRRFPEAIAQFREALRLSPTCGWTRMWIGKAYEASGDYPAAIAEFEALDLQAAGVDEAKVRARYQALRRALSESGAGGYWEKVLDSFQEMEPNSLLQLDRYTLAGLYARLDQKERAFALLEKDAAKGDFDPWLKFEPCYDSLHDDPRFKKLLHKYGWER
jgi:tetratricopeptide (TPR) repeat protein